MNLYDLLICFRKLDSYSRAEQKRILDGLAFELFLRKGHVPSQIGRLRAVIHLAPPDFKFNPYHDELGRFTFSPDGPADDKPNDSDDTGTPTSEPDDGEVRVVQEEVLPDTILDEPNVGAPKPSSNFEEPTNPPQMPPTDIPEGWRIREMSPTEQYPNGYWRLEKPLDNGGWQGINPSTMKPGAQPETHIPFPAGVMS